VFLVCGRPRGQEGVGGACRISPYTIIISHLTWYLLFFVARFMSIIFVSLPIAISMPGWPETIFILVVVVLLFGAKKLPELARGLGQSLGEFKKARDEFERQLHSSTAEVELKTPAEKQPSPQTPQGSVPVEGAISGSKGTEKTS
jgi:sec-independent protein translocase protein TatA